MSEPPAATWVAAFVLAWASALPLAAAQPVTTGASELSTPPAGVPNTRWPRRAAARPESATMGTPPPGWALPLARYSPLARLERLGARWNAAIMAFDDGP